MFTRATWIGCASLLACVQPNPPSPAAATTPFRVVALGDSYASGQGAPNTNAAWWNFGTPSWDDRRCNRSRNAATAQAVAILREQDHAVEYKSLACSGAKVETGLIGEYAGSEPPNAPFPVPSLPPQVTELKKFAATEKIDAVTLSIGGNDILFSSIVLACLAVKGCDLGGAMIREKLEALPGRLRALDAFLKQEQVPIASERIFVIGYPDPTRDADGAYCDGAPRNDLFAGIDAREAEWVATEVLPRLNQTLCMAAREHGWTYVGGASDGFGQNGWCAGSGSWINTVRESWRKQLHHRGAMHPNQAGHRAIGEVIAEALTPLLPGAPLPGTTCEDEMKVITTPLPDPPP